MRRISVFLLLMVAALRVFAVEDTAAADKDKTDTKAKTESPVDSGWTLGISEISAASLDSFDSAAQAALAGLPSLVLERIHDLEFRFVPEGERRTRTEKTSLAAQYSGGAAAAAARDKRDSAALAPSPMQKRASDDRSLQAQYEKKRKDLEAPAGTASKDPEGSIKISLWKGHASGQFLSDTDDPENTCTKEKLDYLIRWKIEKAGTFFRIRMEGWNHVLGRADFSQVAYCSSDDTASAAEELARAVIIAAVARSSARIVFQADPVESRIFVDGREVEAGRSSIRVYDERDYEICARADGFQDARVTVHAEFGKDVEAVLKLAPLAGTGVSVSSVPSGASLYLNGIWVGTTPYDVPLYGASRVVILSYPGFEDLFGVLGPKEAGSGVSLTLDAATEGTATVFSRRKNDFYSALGYLMVSLPVNIVTYGGYWNNALLYAENPNNSTFARRNDIWVGCFAAATGVTAVAAVNMVIRLVRYVKSAR